MRWWLRPSLRRRGYRRICLKGWSDSASLRFSTVVWFCVALPGWVGGPVRRQIGWMISWVGGELLPDAFMYDRTGRDSPRCSQWNAPALLLQSRVVVGVREDLKKPPPFVQRFVDALRRVRWDSGVRRCAVENVCGTLRVDEEAEGDGFTEHPLQSDLGEAGLGAWV
jgi:hypothetical protein